MGKRKRKQIWGGWRWADFWGIVGCTSIGIPFIILSCVDGFSLPVFIITTTITALFPIGILLMYIGERKDSATEENGEALAEIRVKDLEAERENFKKLLDVDGLIASKPER